MNYDYNFDFLRIIQIDGSEIFKFIKKKKPLVIKNTKEDFDSHFSELLSPSLDLLHLAEVNKLKVERLNDEQYSFDIINVTFDYVFINKAEKVSTEDIREYLYVNGFEVNGKPYVRYKRSSGAARGGHCLFIKKSLFNLMDKWSNAGLNPKDFEQDIVSFEAYKALSLSSIIGTLKLKPENILVVKDFKAALPHKEKVARVYVDNNKLKVEESGCEIENKIWDGEGLLDESVFNTTKISTGTKTKSLSKNGMMLLRNRFFKSCVFNTKLQKWFKEKGITEVSQLNGITFAKKIKDIKMVITESSLKYLKMVKDGYSKDAIKKWCSIISDSDGYSLFGIVKTDKPQRFFYGDMVETTYQLINTLHLKDKKALKLLSLNIDYIRKIRNIKQTPEYLRLYLKGEVDPFDDFADKMSENIDDSEYEIDEIAEETIYTYKKIVCDTLLDINKDVLRTSTFRYFVYDETINSLAMKLYDGRVLVHGTYATLFGNPYELLLYIVNEFKDGKSVFLHNGEICSSFFEENGKEIVGVRSPHVTMGNLLLAKNKRDNNVEKWFNLTREIVIVDAIENNIQYRLNGADYDSDTMLITDNEVIVSAVKEQYQHFTVPYSDFNPLKDAKIDTSINPLVRLSAIDNKIANNMVGLIINYSQLLNSYYWDLYNKNKKDPNLKSIYLNIAKLAILSGAEIDSAKRSFPFSSKDELSEMRDYLVSLDLISVNEKHTPRQPLFFYKISNKKDCPIGKIENHIKANIDSKFQTAMDFLWKNIHEEYLCGGRFRNVLTFSDLTKGNISKGRRGGKQYQLVKTVISNLEEIYKYTGNTYHRTSESDFELEKRKFKLIINKCLSKIKKHIQNIEMVRLTIVRLDKLQRKSGTELERGKYCNLFLLLFYLIYKLKGSEAYEFFGALFLSNTPVHRLQNIPYSPDSTYSLFNKYSYKIKTSAIDHIIDLIFE